VKDLNPPPKTPYARVPSSVIRGSGRGVHVSPLSRLGPAGNFVDRLPAHGGQQR
jgi:hypothetical protein